MGIIDSLCHMKLDNDDLHYNAEHPEVLSESEKWLIALSAPFSAYSGAFIDTIVTGKTEKDIVEGFREIWDIYDRKSYLETVDWLVSKGDRQKYELILSVLLRVQDICKNKTTLDKVINVCMPPLSIHKIKKAINWDEIKEKTGLDDARLKKKIANVSAATDWFSAFSDEYLKMFSFSVGSIKSLVAWDACRLVSLSRRAMQIGYISREEFDQYAGKLSQEVKDAYNSWEEVLAAYIIAGLIWDYSESRFEELFRTSQMLLSDENSIYKKLKFK